MSSLIVERLPQDWRERPPDSSEIPRGVFIIQCDAGYKEGIAGISTFVKTSGRDYRPKDCSKRSEGPVHAELLAICSAIKRILSIRRPIQLCIVYTDSLYACRFLWGRWIPRRNYIQAVTDMIRNDIGKLNTCGVEVLICHTSSVNIKRIDKRADRKRKKEESRKQKQVSMRTDKAKKAIIRSMEIMIYEENGEYFALPKENGFPPGYRVSLVPLGCGCPWWKNNWGNNDLPPKNQASCS